MKKIQVNFILFFIIFKSWMSINTCWYEMNIKFWKNCFKTCNWTFKKELKNLKLNIENFNYKLIDKNVYHISTQIFFNSVTLKSKKTNEKYEFQTYLKHFTLNSSLSFDLFYDIFIKETITSQINKKNNVNDEWSQQRQTQIFFER